MIRHLTDGRERFWKRYFDIAAVVVFECQTCFVRADRMQIRQHQVAQMPHPFGLCVQRRFVFKCVEVFLQFLTPFPEDVDLLLFQCLQTALLLAFADFVKVVFHILDRVFFGRECRRRRRQQRLPDPDDAIGALRINVAQRLEDGFIFVENDRVGRLAGELQLKYCARMFVRSAERRFDPQDLVAVVQGDFFNIRTVETFDQHDIERRLIDLRTPNIVPAHRQIAVSLLHVRIQRPVPVEDDLKRRVVDAVDGVDMTKTLQVFGDLSKVGKFHGAHYSVPVL